MSRRRFLGGGAAVVAATAVGCSADRPTIDSSPSTATTRPRPSAAARGRVVVVGAGLAGLTAGLDLRAAGWDVVLIEARDRVGGRVLTLRQPFTDGLHAEAGGESVDDDHHALQALARRFAIPLERRPADKLLAGNVFLRGRRRRISSVVTDGGGKVAVDYDRAFTLLEEMAEREGIDPDHPERARKAERLDATSLEQFLDSLTLHPTARFLVDIDNRGEYNAEPRELSLLFVLQQIAVAAGSPDSGVEAMRLTGGNDRLTKAMAAALGPVVRTGQPVLRVEWATDGVRVHTRSGVVEAARLVLAAPPPALRSVQFTPALPPSVRAAVTGLRLGAAVKVVSQFRTRFWTADGGSGFTVADLPFHIAWPSTDSYGSAGDPGLLTTFTTGDAARSFAALDDSARVRTVQAQLFDVYPEGRTERTSHAATMAWPNERFTRGGYAVYGPGQVTTSWPVLREPLGPIHFAGEHTESLAGYMESAVRSGHRIAAAIGRAPA